MDTLYNNCNKEIKYRPVPKYPSVRRDIAIVCNKDTPVLSLQRIIEKSVCKILEQVEIFDIYTGAQVKQDKKSVAFNITLRSDIGTLAESDANFAIKKVIKALNNEGVQLRS